MPLHDFLVTFRADTTQAMTAINALVQRANQADALLNRAMGRQTNLGVGNTFAQQARGAQQATNAVQGYQQAIARIKNLAERNTAAFSAQDREIAKLAKSFLTLNSVIDATRSAGEIVPSASLTRAIVLVERLKASLTGNLGNLDLVADSFKDLRAAQSGAKSMAALNREFQRMDAIMGRAGGMTPNNIRRQLDTIREINNLGGRAAGGDPRAGRMLGILEEQFRRLPGAVSPAIASLKSFGAEVERQIQIAHQFKTPLPNASTISRAFQGQLDLLRNPAVRVGKGQAGSDYEEAAARARMFAGELQKLPPGLDSATRSFAQHTRRIAEGILLYDALGRSVQIVADQIRLIGDLAREQIRFEAVIGGNIDDVTFITELTDVAARTNTQMADLSAILDTVAVATDRHASASQRSAETLEIMNRIGEFTNVTQRDLQTETENLIGIMSVFNLSLEDWEDTLGGITVMGRNSSRVIQAITDVLTGAGRAAATAGIDIETLGGIGSEVFQRLLGDMSGTEISSQLTTIFGKFADPTVQQDIEDATDGLIKFTDQNGRLRDMNTVFIELFTALNESAGVLTEAQISETLDKLVPPLNPGARSFVEIMVETLPQALQTASDGAKATEEDLATLSEQMVSGPAEQFSRALIELSGALTILFNENVITGAQTFSSIISGIAGILNNEFGSAIVGTAIKLGAMIAAFKLFQYLGKGMLVFLLGGRDRARALQEAMDAAAAGTGRFANSMGSTGRVLDGAIGRVRSLRTMIAGLAKAAALPIIFTLVIDVVQGIDDVVGSIETSLNEAVRNARVDQDALDRAFSAAGAPDAVAGIAEALEGAFSGVSGEEFKNLTALAEASIRLQQEGKLTAEAFRVMEDAVIKANESEELIVLTTDDLVNAYNESVSATDKAGDSTEIYDEVLRGLENSAGGTADAIDTMTAAERRNAEQAQLSADLAGARAAELDRLTDALRSGAITLEEFEEGQSNSERAAEAASEWVAAYADSLELLPGLQERVASTGETAAEALMAMLLANPETLSSRVDILEDMVAIVEANEAAAEELAKKPLTVSIETEKLLQDAMGSREVLRTFAGWVLETKQTVDVSKIEPQIALDKLRAQAVAVLKTYDAISQASAAFNASFGGFSLFKSFNTSLSNMAGQTGAYQEALARAIEELERTVGGNTDSSDDLARALADAFGVVGGIGANDPRLDSGSNEPSQTGIIDIGDLSPAAIGQIVNIARAAQSRVVAAGGTVDTDETVALFKDATFQRLISGLDQRFLQQAIEELTEVERRRLELEQQRLQDVTRSMVTQVGPIQSLVSAPVLAAGGGVLTGGGLNADPRLGNFTINVPINWSGMNLQQLQKFIYDSIAKAWIDAGRGG